jgi:hypothetical protein
MERVNYYPLYELGKALQGLRERIEMDEQLAREMHWPIRNSLNALDRLLKGEPLPLGISKSATRELRSAIFSIYQEHFTEIDKDGKRQYKYPSAEAKIYQFEFDMLEIISLLGKFETLPSTEMTESTTYFVSPTGIYSTASLIDFAEKSFPSDIVGHIPEKSKEDWRAAGRCLAFNLLSATGFHVARAVEAALEAYYQLYTGNPGTLNGWHEYLKALDSVIKSGATPSPNKKTLAELWQMKDDYRNPVMHPRVTLNENDARMLFNNGESVIIAMAEEIKKIREAGGVQGVLAVVAGADATP